MTPPPKAMNKRAKAPPDYSIRRDEISTYGRALSSSKKLRWIVLLTGAALLTLIVILFSLVGTSQLLSIRLILALLCAVAIVGLFSIYHYNTKHFVETSLASRKWLQQVCDGELNTKIELSESHPHFKELSFHTRNLASSLQQLSDDMDSLVESQTDRLNDQKQVLELLFNLTAGMSNEPDDDAAFVTACRYLAQWFKPARISCFRIESNEDLLRCVTTVRSNIESNTAVLNENSEQYKSDIVTRDDIPSHISDLESSPSKIWVPFFAGDQNAGVLTIELEEPRQSIHAETKRVLSTVSEQLSLLCTNQLVQEQVLQSRLSRDRNELAAEIHDCLAQTLLAMRYQTTLLSEKLKSQDNTDVYQDVLKIIGSIEEANIEVRGLIREHRNPLAEHRYADSLQEMIDEFSKASGITVFFQSEDAQIRFTPREESTLQRILGEALNNARKYAEASMIRVLLQLDSSGVRRILVEDDGIGFRLPSTTISTSSQSKDNGEQIGLSIMQERALSIGANLSIDSELGEGTRISIIMPPLVGSRSVFS